MGLFNNTKRRRRSHGHRSYNKLIIHDVSFDWLLPHVNKELGLHYICTKLYSVPLKALNNLLEKVKEKPLFDFSTPEYRLGYMIMDIAYHRLLSLHKQKILLTHHVIFSNCSLPTRESMPLIWAIFLITKKFSPAFRLISRQSQPLLFPTFILQPLLQNSSISISNKLYKTLVSNIWKIIL